ncbi:feruloyl-CoA synthase [Arenibaculum sp.]|uniref:feruloyl-CoA synthase n=1 Tax=Arenibaculum sp. TaxID=2865862 RepID=UPI002E112BE4|nr:feruloyl-CoA synthase [Arenibaculum sp.]
MLQQTISTSAFARPDIRVERRPDGSLLLRSADRVTADPRCLDDHLARWAAETPDRDFLAQRGADGQWRRVGYAAALARVRSIAQALLDRRLSPDRPVMVLSDNGIDHALLALAAMHVGVPVVPVSPAYSRLSQDFGKVRYIAELVRPGLVFADDGERYGRVLETVDFAGAEPVVSSGVPAGATAFADLGATPTAAVDEAHAAVGPDTVAKILFTSGSTAQPKGVVNTQRMLCANQESLARCWPFLEGRPPVLVDWLPWNHTFGGNFCFNLVLRNGGTLHIDEGKPVPGLIERTVANLREVAPTVYFNVPRGFAMLLDHLEADRDLARRFFGDLDLIFYAGAALPQSLWERLERLGDDVLGRRVPMVSAWGATETAPMVTCVHFPIGRAGNIGVPAPGNEVKMVPDGGKFELRVRGPNITPGYWRQPELTAAAFDEEGFYRTGDAGRLVDPEDPGAGIVFDGRIAENFKLASGTWVNVGALRVAAIAAAAPAVEDAVVTGHDRDEIGLLVFPSAAGCRALCPDLGADAPIADLVRDERVRGAIRRALGTLAAGGGSSTRVARAVVTTEPPSIDANEITDKGYINQRAVLTCRAALVERLHAAHPDPDIIRLED